MVEPHEPAVTVAREVRAASSPSDEGDVLPRHPRLCAALSAMLPERPLTIGWRATIGPMLLRYLITSGIALAGFCAVVALTRLLSEVAPAPRATQVHFVTVAGQDVMVLPLCFFVTWVWGFSSGALGWRRPARRGWVLAGIGGALLVMVSDRILGSLLLPHATQEVQAYAAQNFAIVHPAPAYQFILACGIGPLVEETLFRGMVFAGLRRVLVALCGGAPEVVPMAIAMVVSSGFFGLAHDDGLLLAVPRMMAGLVYAALYQRFHSLWPGIAAHALSNAVAVYEVASL